MISFSNLLYNNLYVKNVHVKTEKSKPQHVLNKSK